MKFNIAFRHSFLILTIATGAVNSQTSSRTHTIVVPFGAGGSTDIAARIVAEKMAGTLKAPVIVDNKPGGGSRVAAASVKHSSPDGTTMLLTVTATAAIIPFLYDKVNYDFAADYKPVAQIATTPISIIVPAQSPFKTVDDLLKSGRSKPGSLSFGVSGVGTMSHLTWYRFGKATKMESVLVPYKSGSSVLSDLIAGHVDAAVDSVGEYVESHRAGKVRVLAVFGQNRSQVLPDVPTATEIGIRGINAESWYGVFVPAKTPAATIKSLQESIEVAAKNPETGERLSKFAFDVRYLDSAAFTSTVSRDIAIWGPIVKESGIKPE